MNTYAMTGSHKIYYVHEGDKGLPIVLIHGVRNVRSAKQWIRAVFIEIDTICERHGMRLLTVEGRTIQPGLHHTSCQLQPCNRSSASRQECPCALADERGQQQAVLPTGTACRC